MELQPAWAIIDRRFGFKRVGLHVGPLTELRAKYRLRVSRASRRVEILALK